jgi:hypothetical protein
MTRERGMFGTGQQQSSSELTDEQKGHTGKEQQPQKVRHFHERGA